MTRRYPGYDMRPAEEANWSLYGACRRCGAEAGKPCFDRRSHDYDASRNDYPRLTKKKPCNGRSYECPACQR